MNDFNIILKNGTEKKVGKIALNCLHHTFLIPQQWRCSRDRGSQNCWQVELLLCSTADSAIWTWLMPQQSQFPGGHMCLEACACILHHQANCSVLTSPAGLPAWAGVCIHCVVRYLICSHNSPFFSIMFHVMSWIFFAPNSYVKVLIFNPPECDCLWKSGLWKGHSVKMRSYEWFLFQSDWFSYKKRELGHRKFNK